MQTQLTSEVCITQPCSLAYACPTRPCRWAILTSQVYVLPFLFPPSPPFPLSYPLRWQAEPDEKSCDQAFVLYRSLTRPDTELPWRAIDTLLRRVLEVAVHAPPDGGYASVGAARIAAH